MDLEWANSKRERSWHAKKHRALGENWRPSLLKISSRLGPQQSVASISYSLTIPNQCSEGNPIPPARLLKVQASKANSENEFLILRHTSSRVRVWQAIRSTCCQKTWNQGMWILTNGHFLLFDPINYLVRPGFSLQKGSHFYGVIRVIEILK